MRLILFLCCLCWLYRGWTQPQSVILTPPFSNWSSAHTPLLNYQTDTAYFNAQQPWHGLAYVELPMNGPAILELVITNADAKQAVIGVVLEEKQGSDLMNWHTSLQKTLPMVRNTQSWYTFELIPPTHLQSAYDLVDLGRLLSPGRQHQGWYPLSYQILGKEQRQHLQVQIASQAPNWTPFWEQLEHFEALAQQLEGIRRRQATLRQNCQPFSFDQVQTWATELRTLRANKIESDVNLMASVEQLKIITETLPATTPDFLKRDVHTLLLLDVALLEQPLPVERERLLNRKADLLRQLSLYPILKRALQAYTRASSSTAQDERQQAMNQQVLTRLEGQFSPYKRLYQRYQILEEKAQFLDQQLSQSLSQ